MSLALTVLLYLTGMQCFNKFAKLYLKLSTQTVPPQPIQPKKKTLACHARLCLIIISFLTVYLFLSSETLLNIFFEEHLNIVNHTLSHSNSTTELELF